MGEPVEIVVVLVGHEIRFRVFVIHGANQADRAVTPFKGIAVLNLGAVRGHELAALITDVARHHQAHAIPLGGPDHGVGDAGVPARAVEDDPFTGEPARTLPSSIIRNRHDLDRAPGVEKSAFAKTATSGYSSLNRRMRSNGVLPIRSVIVSPIALRTSVNAGCAGCCGVVTPMSWPRLPAPPEIRQHRGADRR